MPVHPWGGFSKNSKCPHGSESPELILAAGMPGCPPTLDTWPARYLSLTQLYLETPDQSCSRYSSINSESQPLCKSRPVWCRTSERALSRALHFQQEGRAGKAASVPEGSSPGAATASGGSRGQGQGQDPASCQGIPPRGDECWEQEGQEEPPLSLPSVVCLGDHK